MSETVNIPTEEEKTIPENENNDYRGPLGPYEDEIHIRRFAEKHRNAPLYNGAFKQVKFILLSAESMASHLKSIRVDTMNGLLNHLIVLFFLLSCLIIPISLLQIWVTFK
jgi:hypothetical protein